MHGVNGRGCPQYKRRVGGGERGRRCVRAFPIGSVIARRATPRVSIHELSLSLQPSFSSDGLIILWFLSKRTIFLSPNPILASLALRPTNSCSHLPKPSSHPLDHTLTTAAATFTSPRRLREERTRSRSGNGGFLSDTGVALHRSHLEDNYRLEGGICCGSCLSFRSWWELEECRSIGVGMIWIWRKGAILSVGIRGSRSSSGWYERSGKPKH